VKTRLFFGAFLTIMALVFLFSGAMVSAQGEQASLVIVNYVGAEMAFTLDGTLHTVQGTDTAPGGGQLPLMLTPGQHTYSAHVPGSEGANGKIELVAGQRQVLGVRLERSSAVISPAGTVLEEPHDVLVFFEASLTPSAPTSTPQPAPLQPLAAGQGALVFINYIGEALTLDLDGSVYIVPANGRLQVNMQPGEVRYSASAGFSGSNGIVQVTDGVHTGLGFAREIPPEPDYQVGNLAPTPVPLDMSIFSVSLEDETVGEAPTEPGVASPTAVVPASARADDAELRLVNYIGETLTFTVDNQVYSVTGGGGQLILNLLPGEHTFTASTSGAGTNGSLRVAAGEVILVSTSLDIESGQLKVYTSEE
jgi:hypothetical protein